MVKADLLKEIHGWRQNAQLLEKTERFDKYPVLNYFAVLNSVNDHHANIYSFSSWRNSKPLPGVSPLHHKQSRHLIVFRNHLLNVEFKIRESG